VNQEYAQGQSTTKLTKGKASTKHGTTATSGRTPVFRRDDRSSSASNDRRLRELPFLNAGLGT
jgi:hypothetical protein